MTQFLKECRSVIDSAQWLLSQGYFGPELGTAGNVSVRIEGEELIAITPSGRRYQDLVPDDISIVDFGQNMVSGSHYPSVEAGMHLGVYRAREDVGAVVHTHQPYASILSVINEPIPPLFDDITMALGGVVEVVPYALSGSPELVEKVAGVITNGCMAFIMQNHGALCLGATIEKATKNVAFLEKVAHVYYHALTTGMPISEIPKETVQMLYSFSKTKTSI
ncbi:MAG: class II aldolase/adducin family protein [Deltaproteobacteria bacterium]|uniref:Class II aldolase/adducin family protein n=1 Tax=Candidatus Zymogenus saltonus TaxID=2844893 RepID=A0A9D8PPD1_9DELT|nr:class II aldolase/adducin family protein [Candidatus Zymogenus saltonus]